MKTIPPIFPKEEMPEFIFMCNRGEFFVKSEKIEQTPVLEEISPTSEISEEMDQSLKGYKGVVHDKLVGILPPMRGIQHHGTFILHCFEDLFMRKKSANNGSPKFLKFVSPTISTWCNMFSKVCQISSPIVL